MKYYDLDREEKQILRDFDNDEFVEIRDAKKLARRYRSYAKEMLSKTKNINIRLSEKDVLKLKSKAVSLGIPYQTLVSSIIHRAAINTSQSGL